MECTYCGDELTPTTGKMQVKTSGERIYFCNRKCEKNFERNRSHKYPSKNKPAAE